MEPGNIIEYIDHQKIICAAILEVKNSKVLLLDESNREVSLSLHRILHAGTQKLDLSLPRNQWVNALQKAAQEQDELSRSIDIQSLWEILHTDPEWVDVPMITHLCFPHQASDLHEPAVIRALFENRQYFKFDRTRFLPYSVEQVEKMKQQAEEAQRIKDLIASGVAWLKKVQRHPKSLPADENKDLLIEVLKSTFLFDKESPHYLIGKEIFAQSGIANIPDAFPLLVALKVFDKDENIDLIRMGIPVDFPSDICEHAAKMMPFHLERAGHDRTDLTDLPLMTIDGPGTEDFDDAISIRKKGEVFEVGIHIVDVAHAVHKKDILDKEALHRGSSIYMPDLRIPMLPSVLAENLLSLKAHETRPAISLLVQMTPLAEIIDYRIVPSIIRVGRQLTYQEADDLSGQDPDMAALYTLAKHFRDKRLDQGAVHITLPEIHFSRDANNAVCLIHVDRESPGRLLVAEMMIMANWLFAKYLSRHNVPAVFRSQLEPKERLYRGKEGTLFQNYMQRRLLNRFALTVQPESHSGLGLDAYITATSPIRKYFDLVSQRQIRSVLGLESSYSAAEIAQIMQQLEIQLGQVARLQTLRNRFWILKHLEKKIGHRLEALVLQKRRNNYQILLHEYMIECSLPGSGSMKLKPEDLVHVKIQHVDARKDLISVFMG